LLKAGLVDVVAACSSTPHDLILVGIEAAEADGTVAINWFALTQLIVSFGDVNGAGRCIFE
jgi:hypothetical protein